MAEQVAGKSQTGRKGKARKHNGAALKECLTDTPSKGTQYFQTKASTRQLLHAAKGVDGRTIWARRQRELFLGICADLGGHDSLSELQLQLVRRASGLAMLAEQREMAICQGDDVDTGEYTLLTNALNRVCGSLGLARVPKDITPPSVRAYFDGHVDVYGEAVA